ncbi:uncharacterized protein LOC112433750 isoform X1 [Maylandia zebra]|uniref:uncharacterized protein LOC112433750 isoform X1 n=2 Tax=Maylandia zebra TaxID=106582 RepID=UPI00403C4DBC
MTPLASSVSPKRELFKGKRLTNSKTISTPPLPDCRGSFEFRSAKMAAANPGGSPVEKTRHLLGVAAPVGTAPTTKSLSESLSPSVSSSTLSTSTSASSQISSTTFESVRRSWPPRKRKCPAQQDEDGPYVKKPPNAFMLYLKEQRPKVIAELNIPGNAAVNAVVGQRWKSLSNDQKARYFKQAETERQNHAKEHPAWSTKENYVCPTIISL